MTPCRLNSHTFRRSWCLQPRTSTVLAMKMQVSSWEADSSSASQEFPCVLWNSTVHHRVKSSQSAALSIQCTSFHTFSSSNILMLPSHLHVDLPNGLFPSGFPTKTCMHLSSPIHATSTVQLIPLELITLVSSTNHEATPYAVFSSLPLFLTRGSTPSPAPNFETPPSLCFFPQCDRPSFTPIQNNWQYYNAVHFLARSRKCEKRLITS